MDKLSEIRISQLKALVNDYPSQAAFVRRVNEGLEIDEPSLSPSQISAAINNHHPIGDKLYRKIERGLGLESLWFDSSGERRSASYDDLPQPHQDIIDAFSAINPEQQQLIWNLIHEFSKTSAPGVAKWLGKRDYIYQKSAESNIEKAQNNRVTPSKPIHLKSKK